MSDEDVDLIRFRSIAECDGIIDAVFDLKERAAKAEREACAKIVRELRFAYPGAATPDQLILLARQEFEVAILKRGKEGE